MKYYLKKIKLKENKMFLDRFYGIINIDENRIIGVKYEKNI